MIRYFNYGDIFNIEGVKNYAHGCNCAGAMGKGIALQFKNKFPEMYKEYRELCKNGNFIIGDVFEYNYGDGMVFNLATQNSWKSKANLNAIDKSIIKMLQIASEKNISQIALPKIGAGLGGLNWIDVKALINESSNSYPNVELLIIENYKPC